MQSRGRGAVVGAEYITKISSALREGASRGGKTLKLRTPREIDVSFLRGVFRSLAFLSRGKYHRGGINIFSRNCWRAKFFSLSLSLFFSSC